MKRVFLVVINNWPYLHTQFVQSVTDMIIYGQRVLGDSNISIDFKFICGAYIDNMRNKAAAEAIAGQYDYLVMLDADMVYPKDTVHRLVAHDKPVVGGLYYWKSKRPRLDKRPDDYAPHVYMESRPDIFDKKQAKMYIPINLVEYLDDELIEIDGMGGGGVCIKREVLEKIGKPQFECNWYSDIMTGEDLDFCTKARAAGYKLYADLGLKYAHIVQAAVYDGKLVEQLAIKSLMEPEEVVKKQPKQRLPIEKMLKRINGGKNNA